jgi:beta-lactamase class A
VPNRIRSGGVVLEPAQDRGVDQERRAAQHIVAEESRLGQQSEPRRAHLLERELDPSLRPLHDASGLVEAPSEHGSVRVPIREQRPQIRSRGVALALHQEPRAVRAVAQEDQELDVSPRRELRVVREQIRSPALEYGGGGDRDVDDPSRVGGCHLPLFDRPARETHELDEGGDRVDRVRAGGGDALLDCGADGVRLDGGGLFPQRRLVERRELLDLRDELPGAVAQLARREPVPVGGDPGDERGGDLVVHRVAQRLEVGSLALDRRGEVARLLDLPLIVADEEAPLQLVRQQVVPRLAEAVEREVALEEAGRVAGLVLGTGESAVGAQLGELVRRVRLDEELLQDVTAHQVVVVGEAVPEVEVAGKEIAEVHPLIRQCLAPRFSEGSAEANGAAAGRDDRPVPLHDGLALAVAADAVVLAVGPLLLPQAALEILVELLSPSLGQLGSSRGGSVRRDAEGPRGAEDGEESAPVRCADPPHASLPRGPESWHGGRSRVHPVFMRRARCPRGSLLLLLGLLGPVCSAGAGEAIEPSPSGGFLASLRPAPELQDFLDRAVAELAAGDAALRGLKLRIALLDLAPGAPRLAHRNGESPVYPASVVKFVYLMAAYAWRDEGRLVIDAELDRLLRQMVHHSSNQATRRVVARLTRTEPGPRLSPEAYGEFRERRLAVNRWLATLGITDLHCVHPTYDGNGDLFGRDVQFLEDASVEGGLSAGTLRNRLAMTAVGTAKLLALLATDRALSPESSAEVRGRMRRDPSEQSYLAHRIAGVIDRVPDLEVYSKTGTWGPIYADAGIVRADSGRQLVLVVFIEGRPRYRGDFIVDLAHRSVLHLVPRTGP